MGYMKHEHRKGMRYFTDPAYTPEAGEIRPMHIFAAYNYVTNQGRGVLVSGYDRKVMAAMKPIPPGTEFIVPPTVKKLADTGSALVAARYAAQEAMREAKRVGLEADREGVSEADIARSLDVDRMTVRKWKAEG